MGRRVVAMGSQVGHRLLDSLVQLSGILNRRLQANRLLLRNLDPIWTPLNTMILVLGPLLLEPALNRYLDHRLRSEKSLVRWDAAVEDLYLRGICRHPPAPKRRDASLGSRPRQRS